MPRGTLDFLEEPIRDETPEAYEALRRMTDIPFAIGEEFASKWQFLPYIERGIHQFNRIDVCNVGGLTEAMKVAGWSEAHYVDLMPHNPLGPVCTAATVHFAAAVANFAWLECRASPAETHLGFDDTSIFPVQPSGWRAPTTPCRRAGPRRRGRRGAADARVLQVLGSAAPAPARRVVHQLVDLGVAWLSSRLEQLDRVAVWILQQNLPAAGPGLHLVAKLNTGFLQALDPGGKVSHFKHHAIPSARFLSMPIRHCARARCSRTA